jgi:uncharacterized membrane protein
MQAQNDYEVNIKAELEILQLHEKLNELREQDWISLLDVQQRQIELLEKVQSALQPQAPNAAARDESATKQ